MMKKLFKSAAPLFALALLVISCKNDVPPVDPAFTADTDLRLEVSDRIVFHYRPLTCQYSWIPQAKTIRMHTDNMSDYCCIVFSDIPSKEGDSVNATLNWTSLDSGIRTKKNIALEAVKLEGDIIWLRNTRQQIALTIRIPENF